jgi:hypothetical protein
MTAESLSPTLEDAYAEGRKDEREAIVAYLRELSETDKIMRHNNALYYALLVDSMDIQPKDTDAKP